MPIADFVTPRLGFGLRLRQARLAKGLNGSELARRVGVTPTAVWNWETNGVIPRPGVLKKISQVLGISESFLKTGTDASPSVAPQTIPAILEEARNKIAFATGLAPSQIKIAVSIEGEISN